MVPDDSLHGPQLEQDTAMTVAASCACAAVPRTQEESLTFNLSSLIIRPLGELEDTVSGIRDPSHESCCISCSEHIPQIAGPLAAVEQRAGKRRSSCASYSDGASGHEWAIA